MTVSSNIVPILDRKQWERVEDTAIYQRFETPFNKEAYLTKGSSFVNYNEDGGRILVRQYVNYNSGDNENQFVHHPWGPSGTAVTGTVSSITTSFNLRTDVRGYKIYIFEGPGAGEERVISKNVVGNLTSTSGTIYVIQPFSEAITNQSKFLLYTGTFYSGGSRSSNFFFAKYDPLLDTETLILNQSSPTQASCLIGSFLEPTFTCISNTDICYVSAYVTSSTSNSLTTSGKTWSLNNFKGYEVRIVSGVGRGQFRTILSSTADTLTVEQNWSINPDSTSYYVIKPNGRFVIMVSNELTNPGQSTIPVSQLYDVLNNSFRPAIAYSSNYLYEGRTSIQIAFRDICRFIDNNPDPLWNNEDTLYNGKYFFCIQPYQLYNNIDLPNSFAFFDAFKDSHVTTPVGAPFSLKKAINIKGGVYDGKNSYYILENNNPAGALFSLDSFYNVIYKIDFIGINKFKITPVTVIPQGIFSATQSNQDWQTRNYNNLAYLETEDGLEYLYFQFDVNGTRPTAFRMLINE